MIDVKRNNNLSISSIIDTLFKLEWYLQTNSNFPYKYLTAMLYVMYKHERMGMHILCLHRYYQN
jgi:hypothetical protein